MVRRLTETWSQRVVVRGQAVELGFQLVEVRKVADADRAAADLVFIGGADAASGGADLARAGGGFAQRVEVAVKGQDQRTIVGNREILGVDGNALLAQLGDLDRKSTRLNSSH